MGVIFHIFVHISSFLMLILLSLCIMSGLHICTELAEEYPKLTKLIITYSIIIIIVIHIILFYDGLPFYEISIGIVAHLCYWRLLTNFPFIELLSFKVIISILLFITKQYMWFRYILYNKIDVFHVLGFFLVMIWLVPFSLLTSLSMNDNILPGLRPPEHNNGINKNNNLFKSWFDGLWTIFGSSVDKKR
jgi:Transmembrane adaptor Erv26